MFLVDFSNQSFALWSRRPTLRGAKLSCGPAENGWRNRDLCDAGGRVDGGRWVPSFFCQGALRLNVQKMKKCGTTHHLWMIFLGKPCFLNMFFYVSPRVVPIIWRGSGGFLSHGWPWVSNETHGDVKNPHFKKPHGFKLRETTIWMEIHSWINQV